MNSYAYQYDYSQDYLMHYGVKGMKWGVRKRTADYYRTRSNKFAKSINSKKTRLGKVVANERAYLNERKANTMDALNKNEKGILKKIDNAYGHGAAAATQKAAANYYNRKSTYTKTRMGTTQAKANAYNMSSLAKANDKLHNSRSLTEYGSNYIDAVANRKVKTWSGRTTTTGKQYVDTMLTGGYYGLVADIGYYSKTKPKK